MLNAVPSAAETVPKAGLCPVLFVFGKKTGLISLSSFIILFKETNKQIKATNIN